MSRASVGDERDALPPRPHLYCQVPRAQMPTIFTDEDVQKYTRWQRFKMYAKIRAGL